MPCVGRRVGGRLVGLVVVGEVDVGEAFDGGEEGGHVGVGETQGGDLGAGYESVAAYGEGSQFVGGGCLGVGAFFEGSSEFGEFAGAVVGTVGCPVRVGVGGGDTTEGDELVPGEAAGGEHCGKGGEFLEGVGDPDGFAGVGMGVAGGHGQPGGHGGLAVGGPGPAVVEFDDDGELLGYQGSGEAHELAQVVGEGVVGDVGEGTTGGWSGVGLFVGGGFFGWGALVAIEHVYDRSPGFCVFPLTFHSLYR